MDVRYINPFVEGVDTVFRTMLDMEPRRNGVRVTDGKGGNAELTALIGISGKMHGVVVLRFPQGTALQLAGRMLGSAPVDINEEVVDAISEITNMVAGSAKSKFELDPPLQLGLPTVVEGRDYNLKYPSKSMWLEVQFGCAAGDFSMEVTFEANN